MLHLSWRGGLDMVGAQGETMSDTSQGRDRWLASDGKWYAPELATQPAAPPPPPTTTGVDDNQEVDSDAEGAIDGSEKKSKPKKVMIQKVVYLGGLPGDKGGYSGNMIVTDECIGMGSLTPKKSPVRWDEMAGI